MMTANAPEASVREHERCEIEVIFLHDKTMRFLHMNIVVTNL